MNKRYEEPKAQVMQFDIEDIITLSGGSTGGNANEGNTGSNWD